LQTIPIKSNLSMSLGFDLDAASGLTHWLYIHQAFDIWKETHGSLWWNVVRANTNQSHKSRKKLEQRQTLEGVIRCLSGISTPCWPVTQPLSQAGKWVTRHLTYRYGELIDKLCNDHYAAETATYLSVVCLDS
jgi:hypothetical protein